MKNLVETERMKIEGDVKNQWILKIFSDFSNKELPPFITTNKKNQIICNDEKTFRFDVNTFVKIDLSDYLEINRESEFFLKIEIFVNIL